MKEFLIANWGWIVTALIPLALGIVRLTPTSWDDKILQFIIKLIELIPDNKKGGGTSVYKVVEKEVKSE